MSTLTALGRVRVVVGAVFLLRTTPLIHALPGLYANHGGPLLGWPVEGRVEAAVFGLVLPATAIKALIVVRTLGGVLFLLGVFARPAGISAAIAAYLVYAQEPFALIFTLHVLYTSVLLLACTDAVAAVAIVPARARSPRSSLWLIRGFLASVYLWSGVAKLRPDWLAGRTLTALRANGYAEGWVAELALRTPARAMASAWSVALLELALPFLLFFRRTRFVGIAVACAMHGVFEVAMHPDVFGWVMVALLGAWFVDDPTSPPGTDTSHRPA